MCRVDRYNYSDLPLLIQQISLEFKTIYYGKNVLESRVLRNRQVVPVENVCLQGL